MQAQAVKQLGLVRRHQRRQPRGFRRVRVGRVIGHRYIHGIYGSRSEPPPRGAVYVGAGIGAAVIPLCLGERARREVAIFELGAQPGSFAEHHDEQAALPGRPPSERRQAKRVQAVEDKQARRDRKAARKPRPDE